MRILAFLLILACGGQVFAAEDNNAQKQGVMENKNGVVLDLGIFQTPTGAITVIYGGDVVDPYFANRALLLAYYGGMDITVPARKWIAWGLQHQQKNGLFSRYCGSDAKGWIACRESDADDASLALWLELLYKMASDNEIPKEWLDSMAKAKAQLDSLYDRKLGIYYISQAQRVGLFMDNVEIYSALINIAKEQKRLKMTISSWFTGQKANNLLKNIRMVFGNGAAFSISTQGGSSGDKFYPDKVAEVFPYLSELPEEATAGWDVSFTDWLQKNGKSWLDMNVDAYPWGLIAVTTLKEGWPNVAHCWMQKAEPLRYGKRWNVLEEVSYLYVRGHIRSEGRVACSGMSGIM